MIKKMFSLLIVSVAAFSAAAGSLRAEQVELAPLLKQIREVGPKGQGHREAIFAMKQLTRADVEQLPAILAGMDGDVSVLVENWVRGAAEGVADLAIANGKELPIDSLTTFINQKSHAPRARRLAYELIQRVDEAAAAKLVPGFLNDPSLELRRDAVALALGKAGSIAEAGDKKTAGAAYRVALTAARDLDQIKETAKILRELGQEVDLPTHFGFVTKWRLIGPFDNTNKSGFDVAYPPEREINFTAKYEGKETTARWTLHATEDEFGIVDLAKALDKYKGAIAYAYAVFESDTARDVELRLGCINGNKIWLNGKLLTANHVYHAGMNIDQYTGKGRLNKGRNEILLKIAQNEQTEAWAQRWQFQLRVCDQYGTAVLAKNREFRRAAALPAARR